MELNHESAQRSWNEYLLLNVKENSTKFPIETIYPKPQTHNQNHKKEDATTKLHDRAVEKDATK